MWWTATLQPVRAARWVHAQVDALYFMCGDEGFDAEAETAELRALVTRYLGQPSSSTDHLGDPLDDVGHGDVLALAGAAVLDLDHAVGQAAADDDDRRHADQLGVLELHARRHRVAVVEQHAQAGGLELGGQRLGGRRRSAPSLPVDDDVDVGRGDLARPAQADRRRSVASATAATARETPMP